MNATLQELADLLDIEPITAIDAIAVVRENRTHNASAGTWRVGRKVPRNLYRGLGPGDDIGRLDRHQDAIHVAAEANPEHVRASIRHWRGVTGRHKPIGGTHPAPRYCSKCYSDTAMYPARWPCPDLLEVIADVRAWLAAA